jgi:site-specific recombinase
MAGYMAYRYNLHYNIALTKWDKLLFDLSPVHSLALFHAAIAGLFLFLSGIIAGSVANRDKFRHMYYRIAEHPLLKKPLGAHVPKNSRLVRTEMGGHSE